MQGELLHILHVATKNKNAIQNAVHQRDVYIVGKTPPPVSEILIKSAANEMETIRFEVGPNKNYFVARFKPTILGKLTYSFVNHWISEPILATATKRDKTAKLQPLGINENNNNNNNNVTEVVNADVNSDDNLSIVSSQPSPLSTPNGSVPNTPQTQEEVRGPEHEQDQPLSDDPIVDFAFDLDPFFIPDFSNNLGDKIDSVTIPPSNRKREREDDYQFEFYFELNAKRGRYDETQCKFSSFQSSTSRSLTSFFSFSFHNRHTVLEEF